MRNYIATGPTGQPMNYCFNELVCSFTTEELAKHLRDEAARIARDAETGLKELADLITAAETGEPPNGYTREAYLQNLRSVESAERAELGQIQRKLNLIAERLPAGATFELPARDLIGALRTDRRNGQLLSGALLELRRTALGMDAAAAG